MASTTNDNDWKIFSDLYIKQTLLGKKIDKMEKSVDLSCSLEGIDDRVASMLYSDLRDMVKDFDLLVDKLNLACETLLENGVTDEMIDQKIKQLKDQCSQRPSQQS